MKGKAGIIIVILLIIFLTGYVKGNDLNTISVVPPQKTVGVGQTFSLQINITPVEPISSAACNLSFNPSILQALEVENGNLFEIWLGGLGLPIIDNVNGTITYIIGASNDLKTEEGIFVVITFQAIAEGTSYINIEDPVIHGSKNVNVINGSVTVVGGGDFTPPEINLIEYPPSSINYRDIHFEWNATDNVSPPENITFSYKLEGYEGWHAWGNVKQAYYYGLNAGSYTFMIRAKDDAGNIGWLNYSFNIIDNTPPTISNVVVSPPIQAINGIVNISCNIVDDFGIDEAKAIITYPDASVHEFDLMHNSKYYISQTYSMAGTYEFYIYAKDVNGNAASSSTMQFEIVEGDFIPPEITDVAVNPLLQDVGKDVTISAVVTDNVAVANVFLNITYPDGSHKNFSIFQNKSNNVYYCIKSYNMIGTYEFYIYAVDNSSNGNSSTLFTFEIQDLTPPNVEIISPKGGEVVGGLVTIEWNATDVGGVAGVTIKYSPNNGLTWHNIVVNTPNDGEYIWNASGLADGNEYLIQVIAFDSVGNTGKDFSDEFTLDNTKPSLTIEKPRTCKLYVFDKEVLPIIGKKAVIIGKITILAQATDTTSSVDKVEFYIDGSLKKEDNSTPYEWQWDEKAMGVHSIKVVAYDKAGNKEIKEMEVFIIHPL